MSVQNKPVGVAPGIQFYEGRNKPFRVLIKFANKTKCCGYFATFEEAQKQLALMKNWRKITNSLPQID